MKHCLAVRKSLSSPGLGRDWNVWISKQCKLILMTCCLLQQKHILVVTWH